MVHKKWLEFGDNQNAFNIMERNSIWSPFLSTFSYKKITDQVWLSTFCWCFLGRFFFTPQINLGLSSFKISFRFHSQMNRERFLSDLCKNKIFWVWQKIEWGSIYWRALIITCKLIRVNRKHTRRILCDFF